tara:strand:+ start:2106 stop:2567 length:462 start_codon:yes stop_codon:yes gene_type:complete
MARYKNDKVLKIIGKRIFNHRIKEEMEIEDVAEMTGFSYNTISNIENGSETYLSYFIEVCFAIGIHPKDILDIKLTMKPRYELSPSRKEKSRLTSRIKILINVGYFRKPKLTSEVVKKLKDDYNLEAISKDVSSILGRHLKSIKEGNRNLYSE